MAATENKALTEEWEQVYNGGNADGETSVTVQFSEQGRFNVWVCNLDEEPGKDGGLVVSNIDGDIYPKWFSAGNLKSNTLIYARALTPSCKVCVVRT